MADATINIDVKVSPPDPLENLVKQTKEAESEASSLGATFGKVGAALASLGALKGTFDFVINATRQFEDLTTQLQGFTGSTESAAAQLEALSSIPGPSLSELVAADKALLSFGVSANKTVDQLRQLNDVAIGSGAKIGDLAEIFGKIQEQGNLTGETFGKLSKQIPGFTSIFAEALGVPRTALKKLAEDGKISSDQITAALSKITSEGGKYFEQATKQSQTLSGSLNGLSDSATALGAAIGSSLVPGLATATNSLSSFLGKLGESIKIEKNIASDETLRRISSLSERIKETTSTLETYQKIANIENKLAKAAASFPFGGTEGVQKTIETLTQKIADLNAERSKLVDQKGSENFAKQLEAQGKIAELAQENAKEKSVAAAQDLENKKKEIEDKAAADRAARIQEAEKNITLIELQEAAVRQAIKIEQEGANQQIALEALYQRQSELTSAKLAALATEAELLLDFDEAEILRAQDKQNKLIEITKAGEAKRSEEEKKQNQGRTADGIATRKAYESFLKTSYQVQVDDARVGLAAIASLQRSGNRDGFNIGKRAAQAQILADTPKAAFAAYSSVIGIPFVGPGLAALAVAGVLTQSASSLRQLESVQPPGFAEGGLVPGVGNKDTIPALLTPGEVVVPKKNFADLQQGMVQGSIASDQVILLQQGNAISAKILDELTFGTVNEKLTIMVKLLDDVVSGLDKVAAAAASANSVATTEANVAEIEQNLPGGSSPAKQGNPKEIKRRAPQQSA